MIIKQVSVFLENRKGRLASVTGLLAEKHINLRALTIADTTSFGILRLIADKPEEVAAILAENNVTATLTDVLAVPLGDRPGALARILAKLTENGIDVEYLYAYLTHEENGAVVVMRVDDTEKAAALLAETA